MKHITTTIISIILPFVIITTSLISGGTKVYAYEEVQVPEEVLKISDVLDGSEPEFETIEYKEIDRVETLRIFFAKYDSPLQNHAKTFVDVADKYGFDYRMLPAISGVESSFAEHYIERTNNPFGWGSGQIEFASFDEAIEKVGYGLYKGYVLIGRDTVETIAPKYNPPHPIEWSQKVNYFMAKISNI